MRHALLGCGIRHVVFIRAKKEVLRIDTCANVTPMTHVPIGRNGTESEFV